MRKNYFLFILAILFTVNVMAQNIPSYVPKDGLVGFWPFNGNANDESGNGNHGTVNGATLTADRNGKVNSAYSFDGMSNYIRTKRESINNFSFSGWFNLEKIQEYSPIIDGYNASFELLIKNTNPDFVEWVSSPSQYNEKICNETNCKIIEWYHIISIYYDNNVDIYLNGIKIKTFTNIKLPTNIGFYNFGASLSGSSQYLKGKLDDFGIWNRVLNEQEIKQLYTNCSKETATSSNFNSVIYTTTAALNLNANPSGGTFSGDAVVNNSFNPSKAKLGKNTVKYNFKNTTGCADSMNFTMILVDTLGNKCSTYDTLKIKIKLTTGIKAGQQTSMNVYPNPTSDKLIIETNDIQAISGYKYKILDLQGKEVYNALATSAKTEISLKSIGAKGMYVLHIVDEKGVSIENKKIVLE